MVPVKRTFPEPPGLQQARENNLDCGQDNVLQQLQSDFRNKCYLCEQLAITSLEIEHFQPHKGDLELKYDWNNLFFACRHCNSTKGEKYYPFLNCTEQNSEVTKGIKYEFVDFPKPTALFESLLKSNTLEIKNTLDLLNGIHNGTTSRKTIEAANLCSHISADLKKFREYLIDYNKARDKDEQAKIKERIKEELQPTSSFTAFKAWIVLENNKLKNEFYDCLDWLIIVD